MPPPYGASYPPRRRCVRSAGSSTSTRTPPPSSPAVFPAMRLPETMGGKPAENIIITPPPDWLVRFPTITLSSRSMEPLKRKMPAVVAEGLVALDQVARDRARHVADVEREATARPLGEAASTTLSWMSGELRCRSRRSLLRRSWYSPRSRCRGFRGGGVGAEDAAADRIPPKSVPLPPDRVKPSRIEPDPSPASNRTQLPAPPASILVVAGPWRCCDDGRGLAAEVEHLQVGPRPHEDLIAIDRGHERLLDRGELMFGDQQDGGQEADGPGRGGDGEASVPRVSAPPRGEDRGRGRGEEGPDTTSTLVTALIRVDAAKRAARR